MLRHVPFLELFLLVAFTAFVCYTKHGRYNVCGLYSLKRLTEAVFCSQIEHVLVRERQAPSVCPEKQQIHRETVAVLLQCSKLERDPRVVEQSTLEKQQSQQT